MNDFIEEAPVPLKMTVRHLYVLYRRMHAAGLHVRIVQDQATPMHHEVIAVARSRNSHHYKLTVRA